jgi:hypothetical protein
VTDGSNALQGTVGEEAIQVFSNVTVLPAQLATAPLGALIGTLPLTAGDWDVSAGVQFLGSTDMSQLHFSLNSTVDANFALNLQLGSSGGPGVIPNMIQQHMGTKRTSTSAPSIINAYLFVESGTGLSQGPILAVGSCSCNIRARRMR